MLAVKGICENGKIELLGPVPNNLEEIIEANLLAQSPAFRRLIDRGFNEIALGNTRLAKEFLNELPD